MKTRNLMRARGFLYAALCFVSLPLLFRGTCGASDALSISEILARIQHRYGTADFEADFVQESHLKAMGMVDAAQGHVYFKPPAMMHWHYKTPEEYFIISDGNSLWIYRPQDNQVMVSRAADYFGDMKWAEFFVQPDRLHDHFVVELAATQAQEEGRFVLKLVPKQEQTDLTEILLYVSKSTFDIVQAATFNVFGDKTSIRFAGFRFNQGLDASLFMFKIPKDADVVQLGEEAG